MPRAVARQKTIDVVADNSAATQPVDDEARLRQLGYKQASARRPVSSIQLPCRS
jgi:hypothetical protein